MHVPEAVVKETVEVVAKVADEVGTRLLDAAMPGRAAARQVAGEATAATTKAAGPTEKSSALTDAIKASLKLKTDGPPLDSDLVQRQLKGALARARKENDLPLEAPKASRAVAAKPDETGVIDKGGIRAMRDIGAATVRPRIDLTAATGEGEPKSLSSAIEPSRPVRRAEPTKLHPPEEQDNIDYYRQQMRLDNNLKPIARGDEDTPYWLRKNPEAPAPKLTLRDRLAQMKTEPVDTPVVKRAEEPFNPAAKYEMKGERKKVVPEKDGTISTEYPDAPLAFRFAKDRNLIRVGSYGEHAYSVKLKPDGSVTLGNEEGITKIGRAWESAHNTLGELEPKLDFKSMPVRFQRDNAHLSESGVGAWYRGDTTWLYGEANSATSKLRPIEAAFDPAGQLTQLKFDKPYTLSQGPFAGLTGDAMGVTADGRMMLVNTHKEIGGQKQQYIFHPETTEIKALTERVQADGTTTAMPIDLKPVAWRKPVI